MSRAYAAAYQHIASTISNDSIILDCGANTGRTFSILSEKCDLRRDQYKGIEWSVSLVEQGRAKGLDITPGDLNKILSYKNESFSCIYGLSVLEHLLNPCRFLKECHRLLRPNGQVVLLTPNISTYFTAIFVLAGKMPSSGPHPDSNELIKSEELFKVSSDSLQPDTESDTPVHRHLIIFSYRVLRKYLRMIGFTEVNGYGFGLYPFPRLTQPLLERVDPYHCHQMVVVAKK